MFERVKAFISKVAESSSGASESSSSSGYISSSDDSHSYSSSGSSSGDSVSIRSHSTSNRSTSASKSTWSSSSSAPASPRPTIFSRVGETVSSWFSRGSVFDGAPEHVVTSDTELTKRPLLNFFRNITGSRSTNESSPASSTQSGSVRELKPYTLKSSSAERSGWRPGMLLSRVWNSVSSFLSRLTGRGTDTSGSTQAPNTSSGGVSTASYSNNADQAALASRMDVDSDGVISRGEYTLFQPNLNINQADAFVASTMGFPDDWSSPASDKSRNSGGGIRGIFSGIRDSIRSFFDRLFGRNRTPDTEPTQPSTSPAITDNTNSISVQQYNGNSETLALAEEIDLDGDGTITRSDFDRFYGIHFGSQERLMQNMGLYNVARDSMNLPDIWWSTADSIYGN